MAATENKPLVPGEAQSSDNIFFAPSGNENMHNAVSAMAAGMVSAFWMELVPASPTLYVETRCSAMHASQEALVD